MSELKTVKEVCSLTGLKRKDLFYYDKAGVVKATDHVNNAHEGITPKGGVTVNYCGYKLYDDNAIRLLQQISIFEKLHVEKRDIVHRMKTAKNLNDLLDEQILMLKQEEKKIKERLVAAEQLKVMGMKGEMSLYYANIDFSVLVQNEKYLQGSQFAQMLKEVLSRSTEEFEKEVGDILVKLFAVSDTELESDKTSEIVKEFLSIVKRNFGFIGWFTVITTAFVVEGGGEAAVDLADEYSKEEVINSAKAICIYAKNDLRDLLNECIDIVMQHDKVNGKDFMV